MSNQGAVAILKDKRVQGCLSQNTDPKKSFLRKTEQTRLNASAGHTIKFSGRTWYEIKKFGKEKGLLEALSQKVNLTSEILARQSLRKGHLRKPHDKKNVLAKQRGIRRNIYTSSRPRTRLRSILLWK